MKLKVLGCHGGTTPDVGMMSLLINDCVCMDAGWIAPRLTLRQQSRIKDILISHSHLDHTCSLPFLIDNSFSVPDFSLRIYALPEVVASMRQHLFNNHTWPDFTCLPNDLTPVLKLIEVQPERPFTVGDLTVRAVPVSHVVPTAGFVLDDGRSALAYSGDTGPTERFWEVVNRTERLKAVIVETSYPNEMLALARISGHLTPALLDAELAKLDQDVPVYLYGAKPRHIARIQREVEALRRPRLRMLVEGQRYSL